MTPRERSSVEMFQTLEKWTLCPIRMEQLVILLRGNLLAESPGGGKTKHHTIFEKTLLTFPVVSQNRKGDDCIDVSIKTLTYQPLFPLHSLYMKTEVLSGHLFGSALLWWVEKKNNHRTKWAGRRVVHTANQILLNVLKQLDQKSAIGYLVMVTKKKKCISSFCAKQNQEKTCFYTFIADCRAT